MPDLERLIIFGGLVGDDLVKGIAGRSIHDLSLGATRVTDDGLRYLSQLPELQHLEISGTGVSDEGLRYLEGLVDLRSLSMTNTCITRRGVAELQETLPDCRVYWDADTRPMPQAGAR